MTHFLRMEDKTMADIDMVRNDDFRVVISIKPYSIFLLTLPQDKRVSFIAEFDRIEKMRQEWFESVKYFDRKADINNWIASVLKDAAMRWNLSYVSD